MSKARLLAFMSFCLLLMWVSASSAPPSVAAVIYPVNWMATGAFFVTVLDGLLKEQK